MSNIAVEEFKKQIITIMMQQGHMIQSVSPDTEHGVGYSYSIGLSCKHDMEFLLVGNIDDNLVSYLRDYVMERRNGKALSVLNEKIKGYIHLNGENTKWYMQIIDRVKGSELALGWESDITGGYCQNNHEAILVVLGDKNNKLPEEGGYSYDKDITEFFKKVGVV